MGFGLFGKVPQKRDFLSIELPHAVLHPIETWLQQAVAASKNELGRQWEDFYLVSPIWRFWIGPEVFGTGCAGAMMPSVDQVGRYFPLAIIYAAGAGESIPPPLLKPMDGFYRAIEQRLLAALSQETDGYLSAVLTGLPSPAEAMAMPAPMPQAPSPVQKPVPEPATPAAATTAVSDSPIQVSGESPFDAPPAAKLPPLPEDDEPAPIAPMAAAAMPGPPSGATAAPVDWDQPVASTAPAEPVAAAESLPKPVHAWDMPDEATAEPAAAATIVGDRPVVSAPIPDDSVWGVVEAASAAAPLPVVEMAPEPPPPPLAPAPAPPAPEPEPEPEPVAPPPPPPPPEPERVRPAEPRPVATVAVKGGQMAHMGGSLTLADDIEALRDLDYGQAVGARVYFWCAASGAGPARMHMRNGLPDPWFFASMIRWSGA